MNKEFYVTLLSNSSMDYNPDNKTSHFTVQLPREIQVEGDWRVALSEISYPNNIKNVSNGHSHVIVRRKISPKPFTKKLPDRTEIRVISYSEIKLQVEEGIYRSVGDLAREINKVFKEQFDTDLLDSDGTGNRVRLHSDATDKIENYFQVLTQHKDIREAPIAERIFNGTDERTTVSLEGKLAIQLGFDPKQNLLSAPFAPHLSDLKYGLPPEILIYIDIIEPQIISDKTCQVVRIVKTLDEKSQLADIVSREFIHRNYFALVKNRFQTIRVELRDSLGRFIPFLFGTSSVTLHFQRDS